jgi:hypothetical protein
MAGVKISNFPAATTPTGPELVPIVQSGDTKRTTVAAFVTGGLGYTPVNRAGDTMTGSLNFATTQTIASATATPIGTSTSNVVIISGTTTITSFSSATAGAVRLVTFSGILTLTHNATSLILPGAANITTAAGDSAEFTSLGSGNWRCTKYTRANGAPVVAAGAYTRVLITASGTWTCPAGVTQIYVTASAGGGGGGGGTSAASSGGGGGGGAAIHKTQYAVTPSTIYTTTIGAGGTAGAVGGGLGGTGGTTTIPTLFTLLGGAGGANYIGGAGGTNAAKGTGGGGAGDSYNPGGTGGGNIAGAVGGGGQGGLLTDTAGVGLYGGGGGGGAGGLAGQGAGGAGGAGFILIEY